MFQSFYLTALSCFVSLKLLWFFDTIFEYDRKRSKLLWFLMLHMFCTAHDYMYVDQNYDITHHFQSKTAYYDDYEKSLHYLYIISIGVWLSQLLEMTIYVKTHDVDDFVMYFHHLITLALLVVSYTCNQKALGALVLYQHDVSDILVSFTKMMVKLKPDSMVVPFAYVGMILTWAYWRLYRFAYVLVGTTLLPRFFEFPVAWKACVVMLTILATLHFYWFALMVNIAFKKNKAQAYESE